MANHILITGRLGKEPELRHSSDGKPWLTFSVAEGRKGLEPNWFDVKCFGRLAEVVSQYGEKGRKVLVQGRMAQERYDKDGQTHTVWRLIASGVEFLDAPRSEEAVPEPAEEDIPF